MFYFGFGFGLHGLGVLLCVLLKHVGVSCTIFIACLLSRNEILFCQKKIFFVPLAHFYLFQLIFLSVSYNMKKYFFAIQFFSKKNCSFVIVVLLKCVIVYINLFEFDFFYSQKKCAGCCHCCSLYCVSINT